MTERSEVALQRAQPQFARRTGPRPTQLWQLELRGTLARRRALIIKLAFPLVLVIPLVTTGAPPFFAAMLLTVLISMVGTIGTGVTITRARGSGWLDRLAVLPLPAWRVSLELFFAGWLVDALQATLVLVVIAIAERPDAATLATTLLLALAALAFSGSIGLGIAALTDHPGEAMLYLAVVLAPLLFLSGLFTGVPAGGLRYWIAQILPFSYLDEGFQVLLGGNPPYGDPMAFLIAAIIFLAISVAAAASLGRAVLARTG
ncbi:MAG TPA: ABC transporter permease [Candidatus Dormibacteraeota bacterium]|nr:ABC transporter permease [Candidatus Saccharimonadales bacterium]HVC23398.1 ABC transporter permease [Candidatus Dormibacteraeota bacterium]